MKLQTSYRQDSAILKSTSAKLAALVGLAVLLVFPLMAGRYWVNIAALTALAAIGAASLNLLQGVAGQVSIGNAAFMAIGGFSVGIFNVKMGIPAPLAILLAGVMAAIVGAVAGLPALRLRGFYLAISTLALHFIIVFIAQKYQDKAVGPAGFHPSLFPVGVGRFDFTQTWYYISTAVALLSLLLVASLMRTRYGRAWKAIHHRDIAAELLGVRVTEYKVLVFAVSSFLIGIQGGMFVYYIGVVTHETYTFDLAVAYVAMIIIGGQGSILGSLLGAIFVTALPFAVAEWFHHMKNGFLGISSSELFDVQALIYGLSIIGFLLFEPDGLAAIVQRARKWLSTWPLSRELNDANW